MLYEHQKHIITEDKKKCGLFLGTGSGKGRIALSLAQGHTLVVCPKTIRDAQTWEKEAKKLGKEAPTVLSKEDFKKHTPGPFDTLILDEAHVFAGATPDIRYKNRIPIPKTSQLFDSTIAWIQKYKPERIYLLTATPIRSPMAVWALAKLLGASPDFYEFRAAFYFCVRIGFHDRWLPKKTNEAKERLGAYVQRMGYTGKLEDWFDVPQQTHKVVQCEMNASQKKAIDALPLNYPDPLVLCGKVHQVEQGPSKIQAIEDLQEEFGKVLVFARYINQIHTIEEHFKKKKIPTYVLTGGTKDRFTLLSKAEKDTACVFIAQSQISAGWELPSVRCTIYASQDWSVVNHTQSLGRTLRANALAKNLYVYLISGEVDNLVYKAVEEKVDFSERIYAEKRSKLHD